MPQAVSANRPDPTPSDPKAKRHAHCELFVSSPMKTWNHMHIAIEFITQLHQPASWLCVCEGARKGPL